METTHQAQKDRLTKYDNPHRWLQHFPNQSRTSGIRKIMSDLSILMERHANPIKWREIMEDGLKTKDTSFLALPYPQKRWIKEE